MKSNENWAVGTACVETGDVNVAASRLYYSVFQAVLGWARSRRGYQHDPRDSVHRDMLRMVEQEPETNRKFGRVFRRLRGLRQVADYDPEPADKRQLVEAMDVAEVMRRHYCDAMEITDEGARGMGEGTGGGAVPGLPGVGGGG